MHKLFSEINNCYNLKYSEAVIISFAFFTFLSRYIGERFPDTKYFFKYILMIKYSQGY